MILTPRNQLKWLTQLKLLNHPKPLKHRRPQQRQSHRCFKAEVCRLSRLFPLYPQSRVFLRFLPCRECLLFPAATSAFAGPAPSSTT